VVIDDDDDDASGMDGWIESNTMTMSPGIDALMDIQNRDEINKSEWEALRNRDGRGRRDEEVAGSDETRQTRQ